MKVKVTFTQDEIARLVARRVSELFQIPSGPEHVKHGPYSWDGYTVELDDEQPPPEPTTAAVTDDLGNQVI